MNKQFVSGAFGILAVVAASFSCHSTPQQESKTKDLNGSEEGWIYGGTHYVPDTDTILEYEVGTDNFNLLGLKPGVETPIFRLDNEPTYAATVKIPGSGKFCRSYYHNDVMFRCFDAQTGELLFSYPDGFEDPNFKDAITGEPFFPFIYHPQVMSLDENRVLTQGYLNSEIAVFENFDGAWRPTYARADVRWKLGIPQISTGEYIVMSNNSPDGCSLRAVNDDGQDRPFEVQGLTVPCTSQTEFRVHPEFGASIASLSGAHFNDDGDFSFVVQIFDYERRVLLRTFLASNQPAPEAIDPFWTSPIKVELDRSSNTLFVAIADRVYAYDAIASDAEHPSEPDVYFDPTWVRHGNVAPEVAWGRGFILSTARNRGTMYLGEGSRIVAPDVEPSGADAGPTVVAECENTQIALPVKVTREDYLYFRCIEQSSRRSYGELHFIKLNEGI